MIKKIISGGQTGVDRAALDAAIKLSIDHGGWIPKGRLTESGPLPSEYRLKETKSGSYAERTEKNVLDADATLIISRGPLSGGSEYTREMAVKHQRPWLHIDLSGQAAFQAASVINSWIMHKKIEILNVAGPRASKDAKIYQDTIDILESAYYLGLIEHGMPGAEVPQLHLTLGGYIMNSFGLASGNTQLLESCRPETGGALPKEEDAAALIIKALWQKLQQTHKLRLVK
jgi:hypothetical protein